MSLASLGSACTLAVFLYFKATILPRRNQRWLLATTVALVGTFALPSYSPYAPAILLFWLALALIAYFLLSRASTRHFWTVLDLLSTASFLAAAVYSMAQIILSSSSPRPAFTLIGCYLLLAASVHILHEFDRARVLQRPSGLVFAQTLLLTGAISICFDFSRINFLTPLCVVAGIVILIFRLRSYFRTPGERRILESISIGAESLQPEYTEPSPECPEPRLWSMYDPMTAEKEVLDLLYAVVRASKPQLAVETGTFSGVSSTYIARALKENGRGRLVTCEMDPLLHENACKRFSAEGLTSVIDCRLASSLELEIEDPIDLLYCDSSLKVREEEVRRFLPNLNPRGLILMHDAGSRFKIVREAALKLESEGLISVILVSTPRGLVIAQKREGRR